MARVILQTASYTARSLNASAQRSINLYPEINPVDAPAPVTFYGTPGRKLHSVMPGSGGVRGLYQASNGDLYGARGPNLCRYSAGVWTILAPLASNDGPVYGADNGIAAVFTDGTATAPTVTFGSGDVGRMSGEGWYGADFVEFLDGFLIFNKPDSQQFYITGALDLALDALDFASAESVPDKLVRQLRDHNEIWMFGQRSTEVFSNAGGTFPFERISGANMEIGCAAPHSPVRLDNSILWLGSDERGDAMVWRAQGYQPVRISTHALEGELRGYATISDAQGYAYQQDGHSFYVLTFPSAGKTWAYDASTQQWAERAYRTELNELTRVRDNCHVFYQRRHLVGDWENGNVYELDLDTYTDNGAPIARVKSFQHMTADNQRQFFTRLTLDMQAGAANAAEPDPQVSLRWSDDGGYSWAQLVTASLGKVGQHGQKPNFQRLGHGRDRIFEVSTAAASKIVLQGAFLDVYTGTA